LNTNVEHRLKLNIEDDCKILAIIKHEIENKQLEANLEKIEKAFIDLIPKIKNLYEIL